MSTITSDAECNWYANVPKVELHLHLEGAIPLPTLWELVNKYGGDGEAPNLTALEQRFVYRDFKQFISTWSWKNRFLREYDDFTLCAEAVARELAGQNVLYAEAFYSPSDFAAAGLHTQELTAAVRRGLDRVPQVEVALVADLVRDDGAQCAQRTLAQVAELSDYGVIGIGLGGSEADYPPELFNEVYAQAHKLGLHTTAHAGEAAGAQSIWGAIELQVERIGHGTRAAEDEHLLDYLAETQLPLEMCPTSNICTNVVPRLAQHPLRRYIERGLAITVNSDDPAMFGTSITIEYRRAVEDCGLSREQLRGCILRAVQASWLQAKRKRALAERLQRAAAWRPVGAD
ncbi:MAG: adenosine deaminase [Chloroflexi bacterium]|nr:adenosine deaminase [Chloroflexota bacterium]